MSELINPYIAGAPVTETRMFFGREDVFDWIQNSLSGRYADHILVIHGQRRVGKTSVLKQLGNRLPDKYIPVFFDLQGRTHTTLDRFLWWLAREIVRVLKQERDITVPAPERDVFAADLEYFETRFLLNLRPYIRDHTLLLTFDEFDNLEESEIKEELARPLIDYLRRLMGEEGISFIFSIGSSGRKLENMQAAYTEFFKTALYKKISFLSEDQTAGLITRPVEGLLEYDRAAVRHIFELASGHPYFTQLTCHELFARCQRTGQRYVKDEDVNAILDDVVERGTVNLKFTWDEASDLEKWSLAALAQLDKTDNRSLTEFLQAQRVRFSESDLTSGLLHLREKDILTPDNRFVIYLLKLWLQKNRPLEQVREELTEVNPIANRYIEIGLEFKDSGLFDKAIESFQEALTIAPENIQAQVNIALTYVEQKVFDKAVAEFEKALAIDDEDVVARAGLCDAHLALGDTALARGRSKEAIQSYQRVLDINQEHLEARQRMAEISRQRAENALDNGKDDEALSAFAEALKYTPEEHSLIERVEGVRAEKKAKVLAELAARSEKEARAHNWEKALATLNEALGIAPEDPSILDKIESIKARQLREQLDAILAKADQAEKSSRWDNAIAALNEYLARRPDDPAIQKRLSDLVAARHAAWLKAILARSAEAVSNEQWDEAISTLNEVLALEPENPEIRSKVTEVREAQRKARLEAILKQADLSARAGKWDEAISALNEGLAAEPGNEQIQRKLAEVRESRRSARLEAAIRLADTSVQAGKWDIAVQSLQEILAIEPENEPIQNKLADVHTQKRASQLQALRTQARTLAKGEKFDEALSTWGQYLALEPEDVEVAQREIETVKQAQALATSYAEAQKAFAKKNYEKTIGLLKEVIDRDVNYKDASLLLAQAIELRRAAPKWWHNKLLWGGVVGLIVLAVGWIAFRPGSPLFPTRSSPPSGITATGSAPLALPLATNTPEPTSIPTATPTPLPFTWSRLNSGQFVARGSISSVVFDPSDPGVMYAGSEGAGIYKSLDGGFSWQPVLNGLGRAAVRSLVIDPQQPDTLYAGVLLGGIYKTTDGAQSWQPVNTGIELPGGAFLATVVMDPADHNHLYFTDSLGLYETTDGGKNWIKLSMPACPKIITSLVTPPGMSTTIYIADREKSAECPLGIYRSRDGGKTWETIPVGIHPSLQLHYWSLAVASEPQERIYVSGSITGEDSFYRTTDEGQTWEPIREQRCFATEIDPDQDGRIFCGEPDQLLASQDWGDSWTPVLNEKLIWEVALSPHAENTLAAGGDGNGLFISRDGGVKWSKQDNGLGGTHLSLTISPFDDVSMFAEGGYRLYRSTNSGQAWTLLTDQGGGLAFDANKKSMYILADVILKSEDDGKTWQRTASTNRSISSFVVPPRRPNMVIAIHESGFSLSTDGGQSWDERNNIAWKSETEQIVGTISTALIPDQAGEQFYILINSETTGKILHLNGITGTWGVCQLPANVATVNLLAIDPRDSNRTVISSPGNGLLASADGCQSWQAIHRGLGSLFVNSLVIEPHDPDTLYAGTDGGAYISSDNGQSWGQVNDGLLGATVVYSIAVDKEGNVYAATPYGIFKLEGK